MPGYILDVSSMVFCAHTPGMGQPAPPNPRVQVSGNPILTQSAIYTIAGCALTGTGPPPCATGQFTNGATRVQSQGEPVLLQDGQSVCTPTGTPLSVMTTQVRVKAT